MEEFSTTLWLAPGMNIHRNPLCGRNFEYYSEDPVVVGVTGTAATLGVQKSKGVGVTIKHYALNSQETSRNKENNTVSERAIRAYLKRNLPERFRNGCKTGTADGDYDLLQPE